ncbi:MAG: uroporphyrinogen decarboxylase [Candidatus Eremiobacteraeota bacterium]|nr:uroporphyrinogen decarboxylase [Candidatus Eremiobacteraeota bacterium]
MDGASRFLAACARQPVDRTPVWMMRQAGRYLPEYRAVRERVDFLTLCKTPDLAVEVSLQPIRRFGMDACIMFSDILIPVEAMGARVAFTDRGPQLAQPIRTREAIDALTLPNPQAHMPFALETLRRLRAELHGQAALVGFCGAPFTLAAYMVEGSGSKSFPTLKSMLYASPSILHALLAKLAETIGAYAAAQVAAGAQAVQIFDTWAGELTPDAFAEFALPYQKAVVESVKAAGVPAILYVNGCAGVLELMAQTNADVLSIDWRITLDAARARAGASVALQGNVDPSVLLTTPEAVRTAAHNALAQGADGAHILNLGHGILPDTPLVCAQAFIDAPKMVATAETRS